MTAPELAKEAGILPRYAREWLEQQAAAGILTVDDASAERRRAPVPAARRTRRAAPGPESPYSIAAFCKSFVAVAGVMPELVVARSDPAGRSRGSSYGRDMIEAQGDFNRPWLVGVARHRVPALDPRPARTALERREGRRRRVRRRMGRDLARPGVPERHRRRVRPRRVLDRDRPTQRGRGRGGGPGDVRGAGTRPTPRSRARTTSRWWSRRSTTCRSPSRCWARSRTCSSPAAR